MQMRVGAELKIFKGSKNLFKSIKHIYKAHQKNQMIKNALIKVHL